MIWHVTDLKVLHTDKEVVEEILKQLVTTFGQNTPLTTSRAKVLDYLGMKITARKVKRLY